MIPDKEDFDEYKFDFDFEDFDDLDDDDLDDDEEGKILGATDLLNEYLRIYTALKEADSSGNPLPLEIQALIDRAYALLQAFLNVEKKTKESKEKSFKSNGKEISQIQKIKTLVEFFNFEKTKLPKISKSELQEVISKLKELPTEGRDSEEIERNCKSLHLQKNRLDTLSQLIQLRLEADQCLKAFGNDTKRGLLTWNMRYLVYNNLFRKSIWESIDKLDEIILGLMGSVFKETFTKDELVMDYGFPDLTEDDLFELHIEDLRRSGRSDPFLVV